MIDPERHRTLYPALCLGILTAAFIVAKTGRDALFFQGNGIFQLPVATMMITAASLPLAMLFVKAMKSWGARPARVEPDDNRRRRAGYGSAISSAR